MSVGSCAYLYQPEEAFDANAFESWFHRYQWRYRPDEEPDEEEEVQDDHIPAYSWLEAATIQMRERLCPQPKALTKSRPQLHAKPNLHLIPFSKSQIEALDYEDDEERVWDSEKSNARLCLIESYRLLEIARKHFRAQTYSDLLPYIEDIQRSSKLFRREYKATLKTCTVPLPRVLHLVPGLIKKID